MILPWRSRICTDCPIDCKTLKQCFSDKWDTFLTGSLLSVSGAVAEPGPKEVDPLLQPAPNPPVLPLGGLRGDKDCERALPEPDQWGPRKVSSFGTNLDISCLSMACPASSFSIFFSSSPAGGSMKKIWIWICRRIWLRRG